MSGKQRALPSWMAKKEEKKKEKEEPLKRRRKRKTTRAVFYVMNEKELIEAAVSCLTEGACQDEILLNQKVEDEAVKMRSPAASETKTKPLTDAEQEESSDCSDARQTTYVSETDLDITEVETLPYARSPQLEGPEGQRSPGLGGLMEAEKKEEHSQTPADAAEEDDALRLVREIFFS